MASEDEPDSLKIYWDHFFKSETGTYEKTTWLDLFLAEFLIRVREGANPKELIQFCPVSGVVTLVGCELLCGVHRVTSSMSHLAPPPLADSPALEPALPTTELYPKTEGSRTQSLFTRNYNQSSNAILRKYLLGGVAWRCLALLRALGVEGLSCCRQLSSVLVWVFGELTDCEEPDLTPSTSSAPELALSPVTSPQQTILRRTPMYHLFSRSIWSKQKPKSLGSPVAKVHSAHSSDRGSVTGRSRHSGLTKFDHMEKTKRNLMKDLSSDSGDSDDDLQVLNRSVTIKVCSPSDDFDYFNSQLRSSNEYNETYYGEPYLTPRKTKPRADDYMNDKHREIINTEISSFEFILIITDLLQELCKAESSLSGSEGSQISVQCINFTLRNLCSLQFGSIPGQSEHRNTCELSRIKVALTELLMVSLDKVLVHSDLCAKLINNGILPMLLRLLEDITCKFSVKTQSKNDHLKRAKEIETPNKTESENLLKFVFGIAYCITAFFHCLLMQCRSVDKLREFTDQFKLYGECSKGGLLRDSIELMIRIPGVEQIECVILIKKLIETVGKLISAMKRVRSEVIHSAACARTRHKLCRSRVVAGMHHHHDILGEAGSGMPLSSSCCVSVLYGTLTALVADEEISLQPVLRSKILKVMLNCGVCCCFSPGVLMESIVRLMLTHHGVSTPCLQLLEHTVYGELGASVLLPKVTDQLPCSICEPRNEDKRETIKKYCSHGISPVERKNTWSFLIHYNSLLQLDNHNNVLHATVSHLLRITPKCRTEMKYELLFSVIYPTFIVAKHRYMIRLEESAYFLTVSCLNIFASLLNSVAFAEQFIQKGGLSYVLELVSLTEFANQCCLILEIAITVEIYKLIEDKSELTYYREMSSLASVQMLFKSLSEVTDKFYKIYRLKLSENEFEELCDLSEERDMLAFTPVKEEEPKRKMSSPVEIKSVPSQEMVIEESIEDYLGVLKNVCTFWKSCASLCVRAAEFRSLVAGDVALLRSFALLKLSLRQLARDTAPQERKLLIALLEPLLQLHCAVADVTSGRSKRVSCQLVRAALRAPGALTAGAGLRALCEALVRVAGGRQPGQRPARAKVPPLLCPSSSSSGEGSSSEESAEGPYASEHSEAANKADDGYEADVEIGKLDIVIEKARRLSNSLSQSDSSFEVGDSMPSETGRSSEGELAHPTLCVIVVDILAQIIDRVITAVESGDPIKEDIWEQAAVGASVSRACAARLSGVRSAPALLRRLLTAAHKLLATTCNRLIELQRSILELFHVLASQSLEPSELAAFFKLFLAERPPLGLLLGALQRLIDAEEPNTPDFTLTFPVEKDCLEQSSVSEVGSGASCTSAAHSANAEALAIRLSDAHDKAGLRTAWNSSACNAALEAGWAPWLAGFGLAMWLRRTPPHIHSEVDESQESTEYEKPQQQESGGRLLHVLSLGNDSLLLEMWIHSGTGTVLFRASRPELQTGAMESTSEAALEGALGPRRWTHVALNVAERLHKRRLHVQVTLFVNGYECETVSMPIQGILVRKVTAMNVLVGDVSGGRGGGACGGRGGYQLASFQVYRAPRFTRYSALHLAAHSPAASCRIQCESPNFPSVMTADILDSNIDWDQVYDLPSNVMRELHDSLLLSFSAHAPGSLLLHHLAVPAVFGVRGGSGLSDGGMESVGVRWVGAVQPDRHRGIFSALHTLSGVHQLLYLLARVVELKGTEEEQASAARVLLVACHSSGQLYSQLYSDGMLDMLLTVLAAPDCIVSRRLLQVILEEACGCSVVTSGAGGVLVVRRTSAAVLRPALLGLVMRGWRLLEKDQDLVWEVESEEGRFTGSAWALSLAACCELLRPGHPRRQHNRRQAAQAGLLKLLLLACKERFLNSDSPPLCAETSQCLVQLVRGLLGSPPQLPMLVLLAHFLLLMHQASDTFVTHSRANFYFLLTPETQEMCTLNTDSYKRKSRRRKDTPKEEQITEDSASDNSAKTFLDIPRSEAYDKVDTDSGVDTKQMKGLINDQIRENSRKSSDTTSDRSEPVERLQCVAEDADLTEYIVVDREDISHTTVDLYTGGIYQQRRLRAGASPGWTACEGLLLLLRDSLAVLPDHDLAQAVAGPVSVEMLIVLANHKCGAVRAAIVRVLAAIQRRAPPAAVRALDQHGYRHLADQISLYEPTWELATACAALITKCDVPLDDQLDEDIWVECSEEWVYRSPPLLALLAGCVPSALATSVARILQRLVQQSSLRALNEVAFVEAVIRAIRRVGLLDEEQRRSERSQQLVLDLQQLLVELAGHAVAAPHGMQTVCDIHNMLRFVEQMAATREEAGVVVVTREVQTALFQSELMLLQRRLAQAAQHSYGHYLTTVLTSAVSLGDASRVDRGELGARLVGTASRALSFLLTHSPLHPLPGPGHAALYERLLHTLLQAVCSSSENRPRWWLGGGAEWAALLQEALWWGAAPAPGTRALQPALLRALYRASAPPAMPSGSRQLAVYLLLILQHQHLEAERGGDAVELPILDWARGWAVSTQAALPERLASAALADEGAALLQRDLARWTAQAHKHRPALNKSAFSRESWCAPLAESAMRVTRLVVDAQNAQRKGFMQHLRAGHAARGLATSRWGRLLEQHAHERGVWHDPRSYPQSWQLDPTEGAGRVRVRLRRRHLRIPPKFLKTEHKYKSELASRQPPLHNVVGQGVAGSEETEGAGGLAARLELAETVAYMARVTHVAVDAHCDGELLLTDRAIHFVPERVAEGAEGGPCEAARWPLRLVRQVAARRWCLQERALELFLATGHARLLAFAAQPDRAAFLRALAACRLPRRVEPDTLNEAMAQWRSGSITNWEYLMRLNALAGRSYNDLMQYPVLPFVLADYTSRVLDLNDPAAFRNLARPMAVQLKTREMHYINTYNDLKTARREGCSPLIARQPHHYASLYSNSGGVLHYLVRLPPFTQQFLNYQDNNFDMPDRTFHSLATTWRLITNDSPTDVKELIPELFYLPELFHNNEGLDLGVRQCGLGIDSVEVPPWAAEARLFTLLHRQALEAAHVTDALPHWVDLVFGYKQTGQAAIDAINVFPACTYYGFDPSSLEDEVDRTAAAAMVRTYGQAPRQLLRTPHPHAARDLLAQPPTHQMEACSGASGVRWGRYCGSPELPPPSPVVRRAAPAAALLPLPAPRAAAALPPATALMALPDDYMTGGSQASTSSGAVGSPAWGVISWGHEDGGVRIRTRKETLLLHESNADRITCACSSTSSLHPVVLGFESGRVEAWQLKTGDGGRETWRVSRRALHAHVTRVAAVLACARTALLVTASDDGRLVLWDLNQLTYIRTLPNRGMLPVTAVSISPTLSDVVSAHASALGSTHARLDDDGGPDAQLEPDATDDGVHAADYEEHAPDKYQSIIRVHTCNARFVGSVRVAERVTCVCYSSAPEGVSVNVVAAGVRGGGVWLYCSWDLRPVRRLAAAGGGEPLSLSYSVDSLLLLACYADGTVAAWEAPPAKPTPRLLPVHALL